MSKQRNVGLDILRILLALMVISIHINAPATGHVAVSVTGPMKFFVFPVLLLCYPAVNTYVLISGYFGYSKKKDFRNILISLVKLWLCLLFYSLLGYAIVVFFNVEAFSLSTLLKHFFPLTRGVWWYMTVYFVLMLISPALNMVLDNLSKKEYEIMMIMALVICSILPFFLKFESTIGLNQGSGLIWFVVLYLTGGGIQKFQLIRSKKKNLRNALVIYMGLTFYLLVSHYVHRLIGLGDHTSEMYNSVIVYGQAVALFAFFMVIKVRDFKISKAISFVAGLSLAAYFFHCQEDVERLLWSMAEPSKYADSLQLIPIFLYIVLGVYLVAILIEYVRRNIMTSLDIENNILKITNWWELLNHESKK